MLLHTNKPAELKPAPQLITKLLKVHCIAFTNGVKKLKITAEADPGGGGGGETREFPPPPPPPRWTVNNNIHSVHCRLHYIINLRMC